MTAQAQAVAVMKVKANNARVAKRRARRIVSNLQVAVVVALVLVNH